MKKLNSMLIVLLSIIVNNQQKVMAQEQLYVQQNHVSIEQISSTILPVVDTSKVWSHCGLWGQDDYRFIDDTIIKDEVFKKLYFDNHFSGICMREESGRVYLYSDPENENLGYSQDTVSILLYDFNLQVGDTANMYYNLDDPRKEVVTYVDTAIINGIGRKRVCFWGDCWIEGIGNSSYGLVYPMAMVIIDGYYSLRYVTQNGNLIYENSVQDCFRAISESSFDELSVIPSIVQTQFSIQTDLPIEFQVLVVDMQGRTQLQENVFTGESIDCQCLQAGVYLVAVQDANGRVLAVERIVKQ